MSTVTIRLNGVDVTDYVVFADAQFTQQTNGQPGGARIRLKDLDHVLAPHAGQTLTLDVDGDRVWGGWAMSVSPGYFFPVDDTTNHTETERVWTIEALDYNVLFIKRFLINKADPTKKIPNYAAGTPDDEVVLDIVANYLVLTGDGISTAGVTHVGTPNPDKAGNVGNPGTPWGACMSLIARPNQAVFFIDPSKVLRYVDVETESAPFSLSDTPNGTSSFGYRDMEITRDGTKLINDALVWGAGLGKASVTFKRAEDTNSIDEHGRWQFGEFTTALYTNAGVNHRAQSYVYGSPQSKRGGKDDSIQVMCTVFRPGLIAGQVVDFASDVYGYTDTLPIRRMGIKFPTPTDVEYRLYLSYDIDAPWSDYEFWFPKFNFSIPDFDINVDIPEIDWPPPPPVPGGCDCGVTDTFSRDIPGGVNDTTGNWGTNDAGIPVLTYPNTGYYWVEDGVGKLAVQDDPGANTYAFSEYGIPRPPSNDLSLGLKFRIDTPSFAPGVDISGSYLGLFFMSAGSTFTGGQFYRSIMQAWVDYPEDGTPALLNINVGFGLNSSHVFDHVEMPEFAYDTWYEMTYEQVFGDTATVTVWPVDGVPADGWTVSVDISTQPDSTIIEYGDRGWWFSQDFELGASGEVGYLSAAYDDFDLPWVTRCDASFDDFNREETSGWGVSSSGTAWIAVFGAGTPTRSVDGRSGLVGATVGTGFNTMATTGSGPWQEPEYTATTVMRVTTGVGITVGAWLSCRDLPNAYSPTVGVLFGFTGASAQVTIEVDRSNGSSGPIVDITSAITRGEWFNLKWHRAEGVSEAKAWRTSDPEPAAYQVSVVDVAPRTTERFEVGMTRRGSNGTATVYTDSLDFDYDGKPCYDCGVEATATYVDTFTRTASFMGTADSGQAWSTTRSGATPTSTVETTGTTGRILVPHPVVFDTDADNTEILLNGSFFPGQAVISFKLKINSADMDITGLTPFMSVAYAGSSWALEFGGRDGIHGQRLQVVSFGSTPNFAEIFDYVLTEGAWYQTKFENNPGVVTRLKIWPVDDPEPVAWTLSTTGVAQTIVTSQSFLLYVEQGGSLVADLSENLDIEFDDLQIGAPVASPCDELPGESEPPTQGPTCEDFAGSSASLFTTSAPYQALTTKVYINGMLLRANIDYSEQSPAAGTVLLGSPAPSGSNVTVCYVADIA